MYRLDEHPQTCVRYDVHAVYLGTPGPDMRCAAGLIGRTQTVSFIPGQGARAGAGRRAPAAPPRREAGGTVLQRLAAVHGTITQNAVKHELKVALGPAPPGATVLGTYGTDPAVVEQVLNTLRLAPAGTAPTAPVRVGAVAAGDDRRDGPAGRAVGAARAAGPAARVRRDCPASASPARRPRRQRRPSAQTPTSDCRCRRPSLPAILRRRCAVAANAAAAVVPASPPSPPKPSPTPFHPVSGFDTCTAPSTSTMRAWRSDYAAVGVYIGGANAACADGNLSASWVKTRGQHGLGAPADLRRAAGPVLGRGSGVLINPGQRRRGGQRGRRGRGRRRAAARPSPGSPIYYDMEAYNGGTSCTDAVLQFLGAWDRQVQAAGYVTGVYSSQDSGIVDMQTATVKKTPGFTPPERDLDRAVGQRRVAQRRDADLAADRPEQAVRGQRQRDHRRDHAEHRQGHRGRAAGPLTRRGSASARYRGEPAKPVRVNRRGLISSRHGPTQRPP